MRAQEYIELENRYSAQNYKPLDVVISRGRGVWVWDVDGNRYLDCVSAYSAVNHGHCHPVIHKAVTDQAERISLISRAFRSDQIGPACEKICEITGSKRVLFMNSGAEAVETALKTVRKWGYVNRAVAKDKAEIIVCDDNFHGRTIAVVGFSSVEKYKKGFGPFPEGFKSIPFGDAAALENAIGPNTVGFMVEPIQGEGGMRVPPAGYLRKVRDICTNHGIALIFDEIQTGLGRTGRLLAEDHEDVKADVMIVGKSLGGGYVPISAVLARGDALDVLNAGEHGSTFGGNPFACAIAIAAMDTLVDEKMTENAAKMGEVIRKGILALGSPHIRGIRGRGLMMGIELANGSGAEWANKLLEFGLLCNCATDDVVRFTPPLVIDEEEAGWAIDKIREAFCE